MVLEFVLGFLLLVAASYVGTTMALRGYFGREYRGPPLDEDGRDGDGRTDGRPADRGRDDEPDD